MSTAAQKQLEEYRKRQSQRYQRIEESETEHVQDMNAKPQQQNQLDEERRKKQELEDLELAKKIQEELEMEQVRQEQNNLNSVNNQQLGNFYDNQLHNNAKNNITFDQNLGGAVGSGMNADYNANTNFTSQQYPYTQSNNTNNGMDQQYDPTAAYYQQQYYNEQEGGMNGGMNEVVRPGDQIQVDKLIPDESDIMQDEFKYQQFLLQQQILMQEIESRKNTKIKKSTLQRNRNNNQQNQLHPQINNIDINIDSQPLLEDIEGLSRNTNQPAQQQQQQQQQQAVQQTTEQVTRVQQQNRKRLMTILGISGVLVVGYALFVVFVVAN